MPAKKPITVALLGTRAVTAATLYGFYDALAGTRRDWQMLHGNRDAESPFRPHSFGARWPSRRRNTGAGSVR
jgi:hypothetical protein